MYSKYIKYLQELQRPLTANSAHWSYLSSMKRKLKTLKFIPKDCHSLEQVSLFVIKVDHSKLLYRTK